MKVVCWNKRIIICWSKQNEKWYKEGGWLLLSPIPIIVCVWEISSTETTKSMEEKHTKN
jgi:hypothetical protein